MSTYPAPRWPPHRPDPHQPIPVAPADPVTDDRSTDSLAAALLKRRTVIIAGILDDHTVTRAAAELMTLDATGSDPIKLRLNAYGGTIQGAFSLIDIIDLLGVPVHAICVGRAGGPAVGVLAAAHRRIAARHAQLRLCEPDTSLEGTANQLTEQVHHYQDQIDRFYERLSAATRHSVGEIAADVRAGRYLDAQEAVAYGLIDSIS